MQTTRNSESKSSKTPKEDAATKECREEEDKGAGRERLKKEGKEGKEGSEQRRQEEDRGQRREKEVKAQRTERAKEQGTDARMR